MNRVLSILGNSNSGKTTLIVKLIPILKEKGLKVAVIKHCPKGFDFDKKGKDSWKFFQTGIDVILASKSQLALLKNIGGNISDESGSGAGLDPEVDPRRIVEKYLSNDEYDLVITEGFNNAGWDRIILLEKPDDIERFRNGKILAVVSDSDLKTKEVYARFKRNDIEGIADFILSHLKDSPPGQKRPAESQAL